MTDILVAEINVGMVLISLLDQMFFDYHSGAILGEKKLQIGAYV